MRQAHFAGILLILFGIIMLGLGFRYPDSKTVVDLGDLKAKITEHKRVPDLVGTVAVTSGVLLIAVGAIGNRGSRI
jgi:hypothetical protein